MNMMYIVVGSHQRATFYYINAAPQWQTLNQNNWNTLEQNVREFSVDRNLDLQVYTGTFGVATLKDVRGQEKELYLYHQNGVKALPVPRYFWKVVYSPSTQAAVAFVSFNNPYAHHDKSDMFCRDVCKQIRWVQWEAEDPEMGISFCCEVDDFNRVVRGVPALKSSGLLR